MMWYPGFGGIHMFGGVFMMFFGLLVLIGVVLLIVWLATGPRGWWNKGGGRDQACDIARNRYARGEITKEQYEEICRTLGTSSG